MICYRRGNFTRHLTAKHKFNQTSAASLSKNMESQMIRGFKRKLSSSNPQPKKKKKLAMENHKCSYCSYIAKWPSDLRRHMQVHTIVKRFKCSMCQNKYKYLGDLNVHMRRDHNMEPPENVTREITTLNVVKKASPIVFRCPICPFTSHSKADLEQHSRNHGNIDKTYQCRLCEYQTYWRGDVGRHLFRHHKIVLSKEAAEIGEYFINRPDIKPLTKQTSSSSLRNSSLSPSPSPDQGKSTTSDSQQFWRDFPEFWREGTPDSVKSSTSNGNSTSTSNGKKGSISLKDGAFVCEFPNCDFKASMADRMESHIAVHLNLKTFVCPTCGKRSNWKWDIVKHLNKVHMNPSAGVEDVITLSIEEAKATIGDYLAKNDKKNKELTVSFCSLCDFKSLEKNRVIRHMATIHKNEKGKILGQPVTNPEDIHRDPILQDGEQLSVDTDMNGEGSRETAKIPKFVEPSSDELAQFEKPYACAICKKPGSTKGDVKKHYNYTHPYKDVRVLYIGNGTEFNYYTGEIYSKSSNSDQGDFQDVKHLSPSAVSPSGKMLRPDSKFSNPKMHGYVKPFKCSICGLRSNWKWDLKKHLRSKHPGEGGFVIMLSIEEAAQTYGKDCSPSHPKNEDFLSIPKLSPSPSLTSIVNASPVPDNYLFKQPPNIKAEILEDSNDEDSQEGSFFPQSPSSSHFKLSKERATSFDPLRRQWKCSGCNYITNWRRNMARHIHRKHALEEEKIKVIPLHKDGRHGKSCSITKDWIAEESDMDGERSCFTAGNFVDDNRRLWKCPLCPFKSKLRTHIVGHMQQHSMKPFLCGVCNVPFMNRGPLHRHLQKIHKRSDYLKLTKTNIIFDGDSGSENGHYIDAFFCKVCNHESEDKEEIEKHLEECHGSKDTDHILKIQKHVGDVPLKSLFKSHFKQDGQKLNKKFHFCKICPYRSQKKSMLSFHMTYHKPNQANRFRCKYCPYFVSTQRLLHQHQRKWHKESSTKLGWDQQEQATPPTSPHKPHMGHTSGASTPRRHYCQKCPYTTNSKNDFIYHKQFHRPKRTAEFKCEFCDYWVVHKRLLKQHMRLHTAAYPYSSGMSSDGSPTKSLYSDPGLVYDPVELTELAAIKQKMISAKITSSLPKSPSASPVKYDAQSSQDDKSGHADKNGLYRKVHRCRFCPYTNTRARNMQLHEMMHGPRDSIHALAKCPYCDYYVGSKGLLSHHIKVHQKNYGSTPENDPEFGENDEFMEESEHDVLPQPKVDTLLQISRFKRFGCERCPYASAKRQHFERHLELHGSRQRYTCQYCDYSVPSSNLLLQHTKLHMMPNQNLLASQSITNLQHLSEVPADVALASALPPADTDTTVTISVIHDHLGLYENSIYDAEPKKLYRCDRCPYANVRRDYLLSHLKFHMVPSVLVCPYCDYSAPKQPLLTQHIRVHFCPLPELSDWLLENGQTERETGQRHIDLAEALKVAHEYQNVSKKKGKAAVTNIEKDATSKDEKPEGKENVQDVSNSKVPLTFVCQYCDREFTASEKLVKHELQHLIGNHFEATSKVLTAQQIQQQQLPKEAEIKANSSCSIDDTTAPVAGRDKKSRTKKTKESVEMSKSSPNAGTETHSITKRSSKIGAICGNEEKPCSHIDATAQVNTSESMKDESNNGTASKDSSESQVMVEPMQLDDNSQGIQELTESSNDTGAESRLETKKFNDNKKENDIGEEHVSMEKLQKDDDNVKEGSCVEGSDFKESRIDAKNQIDVDNECKTNEKEQNIDIRDVQEMETCVEKADEKELNENTEETGEASKEDDGKEREDLDEVAGRKPTDSTEKEDKNVTEQYSCRPAPIPDIDASLSVQASVDVLEETQLLACNSETDGKGTNERPTAEDEVLLLANDDSLRVEKSSL
ncbi:unnamed protein product [Lymnaea stagnalis]|uniref:C2H2-type domain-containing protein n=1 Tax=Lymnaea stagnalis TaxID=6523 RepID=A0AAV2HF01_LYMST